MSCSCGEDTEGWALLGCYQYHIVESRYCLKCLGYVKRNFREMILQCAYCKHPSFYKELIVCLDNDKGTVWAFRGDVQEVIRKR